MFTRIVMLMLIAVLALPVTTLTRPGDTSQAPWTEIAVAAKRKHHKKKDHKKAQTATRTVRQTVTQTFTSTGLITIPDGPSGTKSIQAVPYPSAIAVTGFANGVITDVNLILEDFTHQYVGDVDILLSNGDGRRALVMSDVSEDPITSIDLTLDDEAAASVPTSRPASGVFRPTDLADPSGPDTFAAPAPAPDGSLALSTFDGANPNGIWQVWVMDDAGGGDHGAIGGWGLQITAEVDVQVPDQANETPHKKHNKHGKKRHGAR
jgi:subtilisin-like proprotein convertase family protein